MRPLSRNERRLVELIFRNQGIARVDLARAIDLTGASVTRLVSGLIDEGVLSETVKKDGTRGQPPKRLSLQRDRFYSAGFYMLSDRIEAVCINFAGDVLEMRSIDWTDPSPTTLVQTLVEITAEFTALPSGKQMTFLGVGLGIPGNFGTVRDQLKAHEAFPFLDGPGLRDALRSSLEWDVYLENDGTSGALGEYLFGAQNIETLFLLHIGYGLGGGAVLDGRPYRGAHGNACLPGALFPYGSPRPTLQDFEANIGLTRQQFLTAVHEKISPTLRENIDAWVERASDQIERAAQLITGLYDPEKIILGGALPEQVLENIAQNLSRRDSPGPSRGLSVAPVAATRLGNLSGPIGAASIPFFEQFFPGSTPAE